MNSALAVIHNEAIQRTFTNDLDKRPFISVIDITQDYLGFFYANDYEMLWDLMREIYVLRGEGTPVKDGYKSTSTIL